MSKISKKFYIKQEINKIQTLIEQESIKPLQILFIKSKDYNLKHLCGIIYNYLHHHKDNIEEYLIEELHKYNAIMAFSNKNEEIVKINSNVIKQIAIHLNNIMKQLKVKS
jgi:hypothetical protein